MTTPPRRPAQGGRPVAGATRATGCPHTDTSQTLGRLSPSARMWVTRGSRGHEDGFDTTSMSLPERDDRRSSRGHGVSELTPLTVRRERHGSETKSNWPTDLGTPSGLETRSQHRLGRGPVGHRRCDRRRASRVLRCRARSSSPERRQAGQSFFTCHHCFPQPGRTGGS